ncbi:MAG: hypothetical protein HYR94_29525 [Chloroflexi bacterium]|nr:hypothetical protein [Chloroflexota bacterium]
MLWTELPMAHAADSTVDQGRSTICGPNAIQVAVDEVNDRVINAATNPITITLSPTSNVRGPIPGLSRCSTYTVYYGLVDTEILTSLKAFDLVILHPGHPGYNTITQTQVATLQAAGVIVLFYISIGEEPTGTLQISDGLGPVYSDTTASCAGVPDRHCENKGVASYYLDENPRDGQPDQNSDWGSRYVDAASTIWRNRVKWCGTTYTDCNFNGTDYAINVLGADGVFLDTVDTASPWHSYSYTLEAMANFISTISGWYPNDKYVVLNRGVFFADPQFQADVVRPSINGLVFENYYSEWDWIKQEGRISPWFIDNRDNWAPKLNAQAAMTDGYTVMALDYFTPTQQISITHQISETVERWGWLDYISTPPLDTIRWEVWAYCSRKTWLPLILR